ncbi:MAG: Gfo/Idh/MocA family oxidoreductase [Firmicutes bacterium]|nr:Gfo/Idh/MocA family oxidoreductase [Bacillota bacterium]
MNTPITIFLVGLGGYANNHVNTLLKNSRGHNISIVGGADTDPKNCLLLDDLINAGAYITTGMDDFYSRHAADLCIISTPIHFHKKHVITALKHGSHVLCEKPSAGCMDDLKEMMAAQRKYKKDVAVGFQSSFFKAMLRFKQDVIDGVWGRPKLLKSIILWPRTTQYYNHGWRGKRFSENGECIMDSIASNACAHYLHNMFFVLGDKIDAAAMPTIGEIELSKVNNIETFDTIAARFKTSENVEVLFYASHAVNNLQNPYFEFRFENGTVKRDLENGTLIGVFNNGQIKDYGKTGDKEEKIFTVLDKISDKTDILPCSLTTTIPHVTALDMINSRLADVYSIPDDGIGKHETKEGTVLYAKGLFELFYECFEKELLPKEL